MELVALHPYVRIGLFVVSLGETSFEYQREAHREKINGKLGNVSLVDKTRWPNTIDPYAPPQEEDILED